MSDADSPEKRGEVVTAAIDNDSELFAIRAVLSALVPLNREARSRVVDYVFKRLGLMGEAGSSSLTTSISNLPSAVTDATVSAETSFTDIHDIRSLAQQKAPKSANEMAALVAYYLADVAPPSVRKDSINSGDLKTYFKQAGFKLPSSAQMTLVNAKNSGYLQSIGEGQYRLNPVGYNLVVHSLPTRSKTRPLRGKKTNKVSRRSR